MIGYIVLREFYNYYGEIEVLDREVFDTYLGAKLLYDHLILITKCDINSFKEGTVKISITIDLISKTKDDYEILDEEFIKVGE